jgi:N12 class adenine-specific DNA methylase
MNQTVKLRSHQEDAIWRSMSAGNTLLAHAVGAGKTFTMAATAMKMKQAGLIKKPMLVVPNHLLEQFSREFMQLYPNAKLLVATKDDLSVLNNLVVRDARRRAFANVRRPSAWRWYGVSD